MNDSSEIERDEKLFAERGFGISTRIGNAPCLLVIDVQRGFTDPKYPLGAVFDEEISRINDVIALSRKNGWPVIFTVISYADQRAIDRSIWTQKVEGLKTLMSDTDLVKVDPRLNAIDEDEILTKEYASAFFGTDLVSRLNALGCDSVILTGCTTSGCIRATAVDAIQYGYRAVVLSDAVGDRSRVAHEQSLVDIRHKYADVRATADFVADLGDDS